MLKTVSDGLFDYLLFYTIMSPCFKDYDFGIMDFFSWSILSLVLLFFVVIAIIIIAVVAVIVVFNNELHIISLG